MFKIPRNLRDVDRPIKRVASGVGGGSWIYVFKGNIRVHEDDIPREKREEWDRYLTSQSVSSLEDMILEQPLTPEEAAQANDAKDEKEVRARIATINNTLRQHYRTGGHVKFDAADLGNDIHIRIKVVQAFTQKGWRIVPGVATEVKNYTFSKAEPLGETQKPSDYEMTQTMMNR